MPSKDQDDFLEFKKGLESPASVHEALATTTLREFDDDELPRSIFCQAAGNLVMEDVNAVEITYAVTAGQIIPFMPKKIIATTDIATVIWW